ncbi:MAG: DNA internalization-related competence protein ComEC/Rec2 [Lachnospiraceae bacterium]|nr:DNA internalization-related competence protein ComEC/Rec2 [Lachnospiraceae bacterium]
MERRPLLLVLTGFVLGEVWIFWRVKSAAALAAFFVFFVISILGYKGQRGSHFFKSSFLSRWGICIVLLSLGMCFGGICQLRFQNRQNRFTTLINGKTYKIEGQIEEKKKTNTATSLVLKNLSIGREKFAGRILVYVPEDREYGIGYWIRFRGTISEIEEPTNPGEFNAKTYWLAKGVFGCCYDAEVLSERYGGFLIGDALRKFRERICYFYERILGESTGGTAMAMVLGEKTGLLQEQKDLYKMAGISHILAVSGLHMTLMGAFAYRFFRKIGVSYGVSAVFAFPCIGAYALMTGMSSSCLRASLMLFVYLLGEYLGVTYDLLSSASLAALLLLCEIPGRLFDSGFLLSFGAMGAIGFFLPLLEEIFPEKEEDKKRKGFKIENIFRGILGGAGILIFTIPASLTFFHGISLAGLLLNLIVIPLMSALVPFLAVGGALCAFSCLIPVGRILILTGGMGIHFYDFLCRMAEQVPRSYLTIGHRGILFALFYYGILACGLILIRQKKIGLWMKRGILFLTCSCLFIWTGATKDIGEKVVFLDVGQGDGILFYSEKDEICLIDGGSTSKSMVGQYILKPALSYYGIDHVDNWIISHTDEDHISGLFELLEDGYPIGRILLPALNEKDEKMLRIEALARKNKTQVYYMKRGGKLKLKTCTFFCLHPEIVPGSDPNENSLVFLLSLPYQEILFTGDVEKEGEEELDKVLERLSLFKNKKVRIVKIAHHGSVNATKEEFLKQMQPDIAVISCGKNNRYGHPAPETLKRLNQTSAMIFRTDEEGAVELRTGKQIRINCFGK